jgi:hypothetical protein
MEIGVASDNRRQIACNINTSLFSCLWLTCLCPTCLLPTQKIVLVLAPVYKPPPCISPSKIAYESI